MFFAVGRTTAGRLRVNFLQIVHRSPTLNTTIGQNMYGRLCTQVVEFTGNVFDNQSLYGAEPPLPGCCSFLLTVSISPDSSNNRHHFFYTFYSMTLTYIHTSIPGNYNSDLFMWKPRFCNPGIRPGTNPKGDPGLSPPEKILRIVHAFFMIYSPHCYSKRWFGGVTPKN